MKFSQKNRDALFTPSDYNKLVVISSIICGSESFRQDRADYALDPHMFVFVESLL
jgi:hypothetical protein